MLITFSEEYRSQQKSLHLNPMYGVASTAFAPIISKLIIKNKIKTLSDYGAGKMRLYKSLSKEAIEYLEEYYPYDPAFPEYGVPQSAELVCCIDVLEHIEPEYLDNVLLDLSNIVNKLGYFTIHLEAAVKVLPDGRNAHLIQESVSWWIAKLINHFDINYLSLHNVMGKGFCVIVTPKNKVI